MYNIKSSFQSFQKIDTKLNREIRCDAFSESFKIIKKEIYANNRFRLIYDLNETVRFIIREKTIIKSRIFQTTTIIEGSGLDNNIFIFPETRKTIEFHIKSLKSENF